MVKVKQVTKVLVIDDSALVRALLTEIIDSDSRLSVVATASDPYEARELIKQHSPDVLTLDIEMPKMNGIAFLKNLMRLRPMPVLMISTLTQEGAPATLEALELGAVDFVPKPQGEGTGALERYRDDIIEKLLAARQANIHSNDAGAEKKEVGPKLSAPRGRRISPRFLCAIGASTGGTEAIKAVVSALPKDSPPIVITQHIPEAFSASFAQRVNASSKVEVCEATHNQYIEKGCVYIAPGHSHLRIIQKGGSYVCTLDKKEPVNRHRPSVSVLFDSVAECAGEHALGVLLTGMGADGADALLRLRQLGAMTIAQDEASSVVWGMPGAAVKLDAAQKVLPLKKIPGSIISYAYN